MGDRFALLVEIVCDLDLIRLILKAEEKSCRPISLLEVVILVSNFVNENHRSSLSNRNYI